MSHGQPQRSSDAESFRSLLESTRHTGDIAGGGQGMATVPAMPSVSNADQGSTRAVQPKPVDDSEFGEFGEFGEYEGSDELQGMPFTVGDLAEKGKVPSRPVGGGGPSHVTSTLEHVQYNDNSQRAARGDQATASSQYTEKEDHSVHSRFSIKRYRGNFDVTTYDVASRIRRSLFFWKNDFVDHLNDNPDLYGPFWIASTLVFVSAAAANTAGYIAHHQESSGDYWYYDVDKVGGSMAIFYGYVGIVGMMLWAAMKYFKGTGSPSLATIWCVYGYALSIFIPISIACVVPSNIARWVLVMTATAISGVFLVQSLKVCMLDSELEGGKGAPVLALVAAVHAGLGLALKFVFFDY